MGVTAAPNFCSSLLSDFSRHSPVVPRHVPSALCFHTLTNCFSCKPFLLITIRIAPGCGVTLRFLATCHSPLASFFRATIAPAGCLPRALFAKGPLPQSRHERMPPETRRRSSRIPKQLAIFLIGSDIEGRIFSEETKTVVLSRHGAGILSQYKLSAEQEIIIRGVDSAQEVEVPLCRQTPVFRHTSLS